MKKGKNYRAFLYVLTGLGFVLFCACARQNVSEKLTPFYENGTARVTPSQRRVELDSMPEPRWVTGDISKHTEITVTQAPTPVPPKKKESEIIEGEHGILMGSYTTHFDGSSASRINNIVNGVSLIDGTVLQEGEEFSCYLAMEPFTVENGYETAGAYLNGKVIDSIGGGACQVSTTLYNAVLGAELLITERQPHSMTVGYVGISRDAAIAQGSKDFCFVNNSGGNIYIEGSTTDTTLTFRIWGSDTKKKNGRKIDFESVIEETTEPGEDIITVDESKQKGYWEVVQKAHTGYVAKLYKVIYQDGEVVDKILINTSGYAAEPRHIITGPQA